MTAPTTRETADRETLVMQSIIDAHGQWEIENRNRKQGDGQLWHEGHVRLLAQAAIIAADHIGEADEKVTADHAELARLAEDKANAHIRNLRLAASRDFAVSGYSDGLIVEQDMRGMLLAAAESLDSLLSEIAALRGERDRDNAELLALIDRWETRATQAERQRDEAVGLLRKFNEAWRSGCGWLPAMNSLDDEIAAFLVGMEK